MKSKLKKIGDYRYIQHEYNAEDLFDYQIFDSMDELTLMELTGGKNKKEALGIAIDFIKDFFHNVFMELIEYNKLFVLPKYNSGFISVYMDRTDYNPETGTNYNVFLYLKLDHYYKHTVDYTFKADKKYIEYIHYLIKHKNYDYPK